MVFSVFCVRPNALLNWTSSIHSFGKCLYLLYTYYCQALCYSGNMVVNKTDTVFSDYVLFKIFLSTPKVEKFHQVVCCNLYIFINTNCSFLIHEFIALLLCKDFTIFIIFLLFNLSYILFRWEFLDSHLTYPLINTLFFSSDLKCFSLTYVSLAFSLISIHPT